MDNNRTLLVSILLVLVIALAILIINKGINFCSVVGGLWCYDPFQTLGLVINIILFVFIIVTAIGTAMVLTKNKRRKKAR